MINEDIVKEHLNFHYFDSNRVDNTSYEKLGEWIQNFKVNLETIGFKKSISEIPSIQGPAIVIDNPMTGSIDSELHKLKGFKGIVFSTDRALWKILPHYVPQYVGNVDSSYLCLSFFDRPDVKEHMEEISAIFATTTFPLTIRAWHGRKYFFTANLGNLTDTLSFKSSTPWIGTGGNIATTLWIIARLLGANPIGLLGFDNCVDKLSQSEYPDAPHNRLDKVGNIKLKQPAYVDPVYQHYNWILQEFIDYAARNYGTKTVNLQPRHGILHGKTIGECSVEDFVAGKYSLQEI